MIPIIIYGGLLYFSRVSEVYFIGLQKKLL